MKVSNKFVLREIAGDAILIPVEQTETQGMLFLNPVSMLIYRELQSGKEAEEILRRIVLEYDVAEAQAQEHLQETLMQMQKLGVIEI